MKETSNNLLELLNEEVSSETSFKKLLVDHVKTIQKEPKNVTFQQIIEAFSDEFPEFILAMAEENWVNGYTQALKDVEYFQNEKHS